MSDLVFCGTIEEEELMDAGFVAPNGITYEYVLQVDEDMVVLGDCVGRSIPIDITSIDQILAALLEARDIMLTPRFPDVYVAPDMGC